MALARKIRDRFFPSGPSSTRLTFKYRYLDLNQVPTNVPKSTDAVPLPQYANTRSMYDYIASVLVQESFGGVLPANAATAGDFFMPLNMFESKAGMNQAPGKKANLDMFGLVAAVATAIGTTVPPKAGTYRTYSEAAVKKMRLDSKLAVNKSTNKSSLYGGERPNQAVNLYDLVNDIATEILVP